MRKPIIIEYKNPASLVDGTQTYNGLIIAAVQQMKDAYVKSRVPAKAYTINMVLRVLLPIWYDAPLVLKQRICLNKAADSICGNIEDKILANSIKNNRGELLKSFRTLAEIGIKWQNLPDKNEHDNVIRELYKTFTEDSASCVEAFWAEMSNWKNPELFRKCLEEKQFRANGKTVGVPRAVYFQGFYYISPLQARLMDAFCTLDIPVYFLNAYDEDYSEAYRIWGENHRFKGLEIRRCGDENTVAEMHINNAQVLKFTDTFSMVSYLRKQDFDSLRIYAPMSEDIQNIAGTFFEDRDDKSHILAYPAGKYLFSLYSMWNEDKGDILIESEHLKECLASGWAGSTYMAAKGALRTYAKIEDYFKDCHSQDEWENRVDRLTAVIENVPPMFIPADETHAKNRWHRMLSNPLHALGIFNCSHGELQILAGCIRQIISDSRLLFGTSELIDMKTHFANVKKLLDSKTEGCQLRDEEKKIIDVLQQRLSMPSNIISECDKDNLADVMRFFLGGELEKITDGEEKITVSDTIRGISDIEAASILYEDKKIMFCFCDALNMPGSIKKYTWPLNKDLLMSVKLTGSAEKRRRDYLYFIESTRLSNRYLFHVLKTLKNTEISWIEHQNDKTVNPSVYLLPYLDRAEEINGLLVNGNKEMNYKADCCNTELPDGIFPDISEISMEQAMCPGENWRVIYSFLLNRSPFYYSDYHIKFVLTGIIRVMADTMNISKEEAAEHLFSMYPSLNDSERKEITEFAGYAERTVSEYTERIGFEDRIYPVKRLFTEYIPVSYVKAVMDGHNGDDSDNEDDGIKYCTFCPHGNYCIAKGRR